MRRGQTLLAVSVTCCQCWRLLVTRPATTSTAVLCCSTVSQHTATLTLLPLYRLIQSIHKYCLTRGTCKFVHTKILWKLVSLFCTTFHWDKSSNLDVYGNITTRTATMLDHHSNNTLQTRRLHWYSQTTTLRYTNIRHFTAFTQNLTPRPTTGHCHPTNLIAPPLRIYDESFRI